ncbi:MAG: ABC transporter permease [Mesorhizobium sp.]|nr:MAG: ABC transporter permease [Mesorhizobium sp.]
MRAFVVAVFAFLYLPIALVVLFSFNVGRHASELTGFSVQWYGKALSNPFLVEALKNSLFIATTSALLAALCGTAAALGLARVGARTRAVFDALLGAAIVVPGVVIGISTLVALVQLPRLALGYGSIIAAHGLFSMALVAMIVGTRLGSLDRNLVEVSSDLYATPLTTFRSIVLPQIMPAVIAGFLLAFTFSFDDFIVAFFVAGAQTTLPIYVFASIRRGVTPEIKAIATIVLVASVLLVVLAQWQLRQRNPSN